jgi:GDP-L-fucose synthase
MKQTDLIYVAGHNGMVGSAIVRKLEATGFKNIIKRTSAELDLTNQQSVFDFFSNYKPEYIFLAAAKVGGILANSTHVAEFIYNNLMIESNVIHAAYKFKARKLLFLGSSCIYPKDAPQPLKEEYLLSGYLESTNQPYAIAKIAGIELCRSYRKQYGCDFIAAMPTNLYGPNDNYDLNNSHVVPALLRKFIEAKKNNQSHVMIWGSGNPYREFLHVDDLAEALIFLMANYSADEFINIGTGKDITIRELAELIKSIVEFNGKLLYDLSKPDGTFRKRLDTRKINDLGWYPQIDLKNGLTAIYNETKNSF